MKLSTFIRENIEAILQEWEQFAVSIQPENGGMDKNALRDHARLMLEDIADDLVLPESQHEHTEKSKGRDMKFVPASAAEEHGLARLSSGFGITDVVSEYRALRASVIRLWDCYKPQEPMDSKDLIRFNQALDKEIKEAVSSFSDEKERQIRLIETILSTSSDHGYILDLDGRFVHANKPMLKIFNLSLDELAGKSHFDLGFSTASAIQDNVKQVIQKAEKRSGEVKYTLSSGEERHFEYVYSPVLDGEKKVEAVAATERDVTQRKRVEEALRQSEIRLQAANEALEEQNEELIRLWYKSQQAEDEVKRVNRELTLQTAELAATNTRIENEKHLLTAVMEALPAGVVLTDRSGAIIHANKAVEMIWGGALPEIRSVKDYSFFKGWWADTGRLVAPEEWPAAIAVQQGRATLGQMLRVQRFDGTEIVIINSASPVYDTEGDIVGSAVAILDVTELKRVENALYESEQRLRLFIEHAPAALAMFDRDMHYLIASRRWLQDYELGDRDLSERTFGEIYNIPERCKEALRRGLAGEVLREEEDRYERPDGTVWWVRWEIRPWYTMSADIGGIVVFTENITARKQAAEQLQSLNDELERRVEQRTRELQEKQSQYLHAEKLSTIGKLSASVAHEFNTPLQAVTMILKGLRKNAILEEEDRSFLDLAIGESERMKNLIRNLQEFNRPSPERKVPMDVHVSIDSLLLLCKSDFKRKGISVVLNYTEGLPQIRAIPDQIKQVFLNLLTNAADACRFGGKITISTWQEGENVAAAIKDNGIGIEPEKISVIFKPFYTSKPGVQGTGLGLSVSNGIVRNHQGTIRVESEPGAGSTFTVLLPINEK